MNTQNKWKIVLPLIIWGTSILFYFHQYFLRVSISDMEPQLMRRFHINAISVGIVAASFYYSYIITQLPVGFLMDRFGPRKMISAAAFITGLGSIIFWHAAFLRYLEIGRMLMGMGAAFSYIGVLTLTRRWFSEEKFPLINGVTTFVGSLGCAIAGAPLASLLNKYDFEVVMLAAAIISFAISILSFLIIRDSPKGIAIPNTQNQSLWEIIYSFKDVIKNKQVCVASIYIGFSFHTITVFAALWCAPFFSTLYPDSPLGKYSTTLMFIGYGLGSLAFGMLVEKLKHLKAFMLMGSTGAMITLFSIVAAHYPIHALLALVFLLGFFTSSNILAFVLTRQNTTPEIAGSAFAFTNLWSIVVGAFLLPIFGYILEIGFGHARSPSLHQPLNESIAYYHALWLLLIATAVSFIAALFARETP